MKFMVNGTEVRSEILGEEVEVKFENLSEEVQKKVFLDNKEKFFIHAMKSQFDSIAKLAINSIKDFSKQIVNEAIVELNNSDFEIKYVDRILEVLDYAADVEILYSTLDVLAFSKYFRVRNWVAWKSKVLTTTIQEMFIKAINSPCDCEEELEYINHLIKNPSFYFNMDMVNKLTYPKE